MYGSRKVEKKRGRNGRKLFRGRKGKVKPRIWSYEKGETRHKQRGVWRQKRTGRGHREGRPKERGGLEMGFWRKISFRDMQRRGQWGTFQERGAQGLKGGSAPRDFIGGSVRKRRNTSFW